MGDSTDKWSPGYLLLTQPLDVETWLLAAVPHTVRCCLIDVGMEGGGGEGELR